MASNAFVPSFARSARELVVGMAAGALLGSATVLVWSNLLWNRSFMAWTVGSWFAGGLVGVTLAGGSARTRPVIGYLCGLVLMGIATRPLHSLATSSPYSSRGATLIAILYLATPLLTAVAGLASAQPDPVIAFGFVRDADRAGKARLTWRVLPWLVGPSLAVVSMAWGLLHTPGEAADSPYGPGSTTCEQDADCALYTGCNHCGACFSRMPIESFECQAICEIEPQAACLCRNGRCRRRANN
jgi:hypothetical protein